MDAVVLAGGRSSRLAGSAKAHLVYRGTTLLKRAIAAAIAAGARRVAVVGPTDGNGEPAALDQRYSSIRPDADRLLFTREDPPFGGPAAGIAAGIAALDEVESEAGAAATLLLVLACDLPRIELAVSALTAALPLPIDADGVMLIDADERTQPLTAIYRRSALRAAVAERHRSAQIDGLSVRALVGTLTIVAVAASAGSTDDIDTPADAARFEIALPAPNPAATPITTATDATPRRNPMPDRHDDDALLEAWCLRLTDALELQGLTVDVQSVLGLAGRAAHAVARPAAPLTTFVVGYAAALASAGGSDATSAIQTAIATAQRLCREEQAATQPQAQSTNANE